MEVRTVLGFNKFKSKKGADLATLTLIKPYNDRQKMNGACGHSAEEVFVPDNIHGKLVPGIVGKEIEVGYSISNGRAYFEDFKVVK